MNKITRAKVLWYAGMALCTALALWSANYIFFLAMESARTQANLPAIKERYYVMLVVLAIGIVGAIVCFVGARRIGHAKGPSS
jgi:hypothetical protein